MALIVQSGKISRELACYHCALYSGTCRRLTWSVVPVSRIETEKIFVLIIGVVLVVAISTSSPCMCHDTCSGSSLAHQAYGKLQPGSSSNWVASHLVTRRCHGGITRRCRWGFPQVCGRTLGVLFVQKSRGSYALQPGQMSGIVLTDSGYHLIYCIAWKVIHIILLLECLHKADTQIWRIANCIVHKCSRLDMGARWINNLWSYSSERLTVEVGWWWEHWGS